MSQRIALVVAGSVLTAVGGVLTVGGGTVLAVTGSDGTLLVRPPHDLVDHRRAGDRPG